MGCGLLNETTCYAVPTNATAGVTGMLDYVRDNVATQMGDQLGGSIIGIAILLPTFLIIFMILGKQRPLVGFTAASFVCLIACFPLVALSYITAQAIGLFLVMTIGGLAFTYFEDNP